MSDVVFDRTYFGRQVVLEVSESDDGVQFKVSLSVAGKERWSAYFTDRSDDPGFDHARRVSSIDLEDDEVAQLRALKAFDEDLTITMIWHPRELARLVELDLARRGSIDSGGVQPWYITPAGVEWLAQHDG